MSTNADDEWVDVIDEQGRTIGTVRRREMRERRLPHRCVYVLVFNQRGELFIHQRTATKDVYPSFWDVAVGGVLAAGEAFDEGARREVREELGVDAEPQPLFPFHYTDPATIVRSMVYRVVHDGPFHFQPEEVVRGEFVPLDAVAARAAATPFCPDGLAALADYRQRLALRVLLGSGGFRTPERIHFFSDQVRAFFGDIERVLFLPYALRNYDQYVQTLIERGLHAGYVLDGIHRHADPRRAVEEAQAIFIGGGNTFRLLNELYRHELIEPIRARVRAGLPYLGVSAGSNVAGPTIMTTNDMPIVRPPSFDALGLVPFQINPHYFTGQVHVKRDDGYHEHFGETRDERIREFHELNETPVIGLWEAGILRLEQGRLLLAGTGARIFRRGQGPVDVEPGTWLDALLVGSEWQG